MEVARKQQAAIYGSRLLTPVIFINHPVKSKYHYILAGHPWYTAQQIITLPGYFSGNIVAFISVNNKNIVTSIYAGRVGAEYVH